MDEQVQASGKKRGRDGSTEVKILEVKQLCEEFIARADGPSNGTCYAQHRVVVLITAVFFHPAYTGKPQLSNEQVLAAASHFLHIVEGRKVLGKSSSCNS